MLAFEKAKWVEWIEPFGPNSEPVFCRVRPEVAIAVSKRTAGMINPDYVYESDQDAFEDFVIVHWAYIEPKPK